MNSFVGHQEARQQFSKAFSQGKWPQSVLLIGPESIGKRTLLNIFAQRFLCEAQNFGQQFSEFGCGQCLSCSQFSKNSHPDVYHLDLLPGKKRISIESVREFMNWENLSPVYHRGKAVLVPRLDLFSEAAQNSLLKVIEEPSSGTHFFFASVQPQKILPTIKSRCLLFGLKPLTQDELLSVAGLKGWKTPSSVALALSMGQVLNLKFVTESNLDQFVEEFFKKLVSAQLIDGSSLSVYLLDFYSNLKTEDSNSDEGHLSEERFVLWFLSILEALLEDSIRVDQGLEPRVFSGHTDFLKTFFCSKTQEHRFQIARALRLSRQDMQINLDHLTLLEEVFRVLLGEPVLSSGQQN